MNLCLYIIKWVNIEHEVTPLIIMSGSLDKHCPSMHIQFTGLLIRFLLPNSPTLYVHYLIYSKSLWLWKLDFLCFSSHWKGSIIFTFLAVIFRIALVVASYVLHIMHVTHLISDIWDHNLWIFSFLPLGCHLIFFIGDLISNKLHFM